MGKVTVLKAAVPRPAPAADDTPQMAAVAVDLGDYWQVLEQARALLGIPAATEASERART